jgi:hypothetical protein
VVLVIIVIFVSPYITSMSSINHTRNKPVFIPTNVLQFGFASLQKISGIKLHNSKPIATPHSDLLKKKKKKVHHTENNIDLILLSVLLVSLMPFLVKLS